MNKNTKTLAAAAGVIGLLGVALYAALFASAGLPGTSKTTVDAEFSNVGGLRVGDEVREASKRIGRVQSIKVVGDHAVARLTLSDTEAVYADANAAVWARSGLGQNFVEINRGTKAAGPLGDKAIPMARTVAPTDLDKLLNVLDPKTRKGLRTTLLEAGGGMEGHSQALADFLATAPDTLKDLASVSQVLADDDTDLAGLLSATEQLAGHFRGREQQVSSLIRQTTDTLNALGGDTNAEPLKQTLENAPVTLTNLRSGLESLDKPLADLATATKVMQPGARALGSSTNDLRAVLRNAQEPLNKVPGFSNEANPALESLTSGMTDFRPLAERLEYTFNVTQGAAAYMAPYAPEIADFFDYWHSANGDGDKAGHWLRLGFVVRPESLTGGIPVKDPFTHRNPYPAPGQAQRDRAPGFIGGK